MSHLICSSSEFSSKLGESLRHTMLGYPRLWSTPGVIFSWKMMVGRTREYRLPHGMYDTLDKFSSFYKY